MRRLILLLALCAVALTTWSCIEEIQPKTNNAPKIWFVRAPEANQIIYENGATFEWVAVDTDDDLGMGQTYVAMTPTVIDTIEIYPPTLQQGWLRVYKPANSEYWGFDVSNLPDTMYTFSVKVIDGRGAESITARAFKVLFDNLVPIVDEVECPPAKPTNPNFMWTYVIHAHDVAPSPSAATPVDSLTYWYSFRAPGGADSYETDGFSIDNRTFSVTIDGQTYPGEYRFRAKAMDRAGNVSLEYLCKFEVGSGGPK